MSQSSAGSDYTNTEPANEIGKANDDSGGEHGISREFGHLIGGDVLVDLDLAELGYHDNGDD